MDHDRFVHLLDCWRVARERRLVLPATTCVVEWIERTGRRGRAGETSQRGPLLMRTFGGASGGSARAPRLFGGRYPWRLELW